MTLSEAATLLERNKSYLRKDGSQNTKIVATVGPACNTYEKLLGLVKAGVDVFRLNFSHGTHEDHLKIIQFIQRINAEHKLHISTLADLQGPKLRVGKIKDNALVLKAGDVITINLVEQTAASKKSSATAERNASMAASISAMAKVPLAGALGGLGCHLRSAGR